MKKMCRPFSGLARPPPPPKFEEGFLPMARTNGPLSGGGGGVTKKIAGDQGGSVDGLLEHIAEMPQVLSQISWML